MLARAPSLSGPAYPELHRHLRRGRMGNAASSIASVRAASNATSCTYMSGSRKWRRLEVMVDEWMRQLRCTSRSSGTLAGRRSASMPTRGSGSVASVVRRQVSAAALTHSLAVLWPLCRNSVLAPKCTRRPRVGPPRQCTAQAVGTTKLNVPLSVPSPLSAMFKSRLES
jgi:hypothetical protein